MLRFALTAMLGLLISGVVWADIPPPPPAAGFKRVPVENKVGIGQEFPDHIFFIGQNSRFGGIAAVTEVKLTTKEAAKVSLGHVGICLIAVPKDAGKAYATEKEFHAALVNGKVTGATQKDLSARRFQDIKKDDPRTEITTEFIVEKIDPKDGILLREPKKKEKGAGETAEDEGLNSSEPVTTLPRGGVWVAGVAGFLGLTLAGLWLVRRFGGAPQAD